jgi:hypothetical protein
MPLVSKQNPRAVNAVRWHLSGVAVGAKNRLLLALELANKGLRLECPV